MMCGEPGFPKVGAYRGISTYEYFDDPDCEFINQGAFQFSDVGRDDGLKECSINWIDDEGALANIARAKKTRNEMVVPQFVAACRLPLVELERARRRFDRLFDFERRATLCVENGLPDNPYHGNLLSPKALSSTDKRRVKYMQALLADAAARTEIVSRSELDELET